MADDLIKVDIRADYDDKGAKAAKQDLEAIDGTTAEAEVAVDDNASKTTAAVDADLDRIDGRTAEAEVSVDDDASATTGDVSEDLEAIDGTTARATVTVDDDASATTGDVSEDLEAIDGTTARAAVEVTGDATAADTAAELAAIDGATPHADITVTGDPTAGQVAGDLREIDGKTAHATIDADATAGASGLISSIAGLGGRIRDYGPQLSALAATGGPIAAVAGAFIGAATEASNVALEADEIADFSGTSVENASALAAVLRDNTNIEANDLKDIISQVTGALASNPALMEQLGIKADTVRQGPFATFIAAVDAWNSGQLTANEKMTVGAQLFGEEGIRQISSLTSALDTDLATAIAGVSENRIISDADVEAAREVKRQFAELSGQLQGLAVTVGGEVVPVLADMLGMAEDIAGAVSNVAELGQEATPRSVFDWIEQFPSQKFTEIYDQLNAAGVSAEDFRDNMFDLNDVMALVEAGIPPDVISSAELTADAQKYLAEQTTAANEAAGEQVDAMAENVEAQAETEAAVQATVERLQEQAEAHRDAAAASDEQQDAMRSANDVFYANQKAVRDARDAVDRYEETLADNESTLDDQAEALDDVAQSADTVAQSQVDVARQTAESEGATLSNTQALDIQNQSLLTQAGELQGPMRQALVDHIARLNGIPPEVVSDILALLDQAGIDNAETALTGVSRTREATVAADADQGALAQTEAELEWLTRNREVLVTIRRIFHDVLSSVPFAGNVTGSSASTSSAAAGGDTYNLNLPRGTRTDDVIRSLDRHARRNGRRAYAFR